jgi:hypothetical protein
LKAIKAVFKYKISMIKMENYLVNPIKQIYLEININFKIFNKTRIMQTTRIHKQIKNSWNLKNLKIKRYILINSKIKIQTMIRFIKPKTL